jgi:type IV pilus assembly protein PilB
MIGEIRDAETANIAVQAALTGHLVLSTLHTNSAPGAITRLIDLGVAPYLVGASLVGVIAQRLVRKICSNCKEEYEPSSAIKKMAEKSIDVPIKFYRGVGCKKCRNTGYLGRIAIHELFVPDGSIQELIADNTSLKKIRDIALKNGMTSLHIDGLHKVKAGITTIDEVLRVATRED